MSSTDFDPNIVTAFFSAIRKTFDVQLSTAVNIKSFLPKNSNETAKADIAAVLSLVSTTVNGTLAICLTQDTFLGLINRMLGENYKSITAENSDAAAEILNIIYGIARTEINKCNYSFAPAIPSVISGHEIVISHPHAQIIGIITCECDLGTIQFELSLKRSG